MPQKVGSSKNSWGSLNRYYPWEHSFLAESRGLGRIIKGPNLEILLFLSVISTDSDWDLFALPQAAIIKVCSTLLQASQRR